MRTSRRSWLRLVCAAGLAATGVRGAPAAPRRSFRIGLTPVFLDNRVVFLKAWREYLERHLDTHVEFVQRQTYREITELVVAEKLDAAWICGYPFVRNETRMRLLAVPVYGDAPLYESYLIVPAEDRSTSHIVELAGKIFAYSDPDSNSGYLAPQVALIESGRDPRRFFGRTFFCWTHRDVVVAVADGLADGGAVDGYVWDTLEVHHPELIERTRLVTRSQKFGFPPFVTPRSLPGGDFEALQRVMLGMSGDPGGRELLAELNLEGFVAGEASLFDGIRRAVDVFDGS